MKSILLQATILLTAGVSASAEPLDVPRGPDIESIAGACAIGPFGQTSKAGRYNIHCMTLTDAEKCLALIKGHIGSEGEIIHWRSGSEKTAFCLDLFRSELLNQPNQ